MLYDQQTLYINSYREDTHRGMIWLKNPSMRHLKVFGCEAYAHVSYEKRSKLEKKVVRSIFIGYGVSVKGYKLQDLVAKKVLFNNSVIFREMRPFTIVLQLEKEEKKEVVQVPLTPKIDELYTHFKPNNEEISRSFWSFEENEPQPRQLRMCTRVK